MPPPPPKHTTIEQSTFFSANGADCKHWPLIIEKGSNTQLYIVKNLREKEPPEIEEENAADELSNPTPVADVKDGDNEEKGTALVKQPILGEIIQQEPPHPPKKLEKKEILASDIFWKLNAIKNGLKESITSTVLLTLLDEIHDLKEEDNCVKRHLVDNCVEIALLRGNRSKPDETSENSIPVANWNMDEPNTSPIKRNVTGEPMVNKKFSLPASLVKQYEAAAKAKGVTFSKYVSDTLLNAQPLSSLPALDTK